MREENREITLPAVPVPVPVPPATVGESHADSDNARVQ
jgi:hypothetical protein